MTRVEDILEVHRNIAEALGKRMTHFEKQLNNTGSNDSGKGGLDKLACEFKEFKTSVWNILDLLKSFINNLSSQIDEVDNSTRRNALLFGGIEEAEGENLVSTILGTIQVLMGVSDINPSAIQSCQRLGIKSASRCRPILVRFNDFKVRSDLWGNKKKLKSSQVVLSEFLTKNRQSIFISARKSFGVRNTWTYQGNIFIKLPNNERRRISTTAELDECLKLLPQANSPVSPVEKTNTSEQPRVSPAAVKDNIRRPLTRRNIVKKP